MHSGGTREPETPAGSGASRRARRARQDARACAVGLAAAVAGWLGLAAGGPLPARVPQASGERAVTFTRDVAPILFASCTECHRPGQATPFPLVTYADARKRAPMLALATEARLMPPWSPVEGHGEFVGARYLAPGDVATLRAWADAGAPEGDPAELPELPRFRDGWSLGPPDLVLEMPRGYTIPADGPDVYRTFPMHTRIEGSRWLRAVEVDTGRSGALHHLRVGFDDTLETRELEQLDGEPGFEAMDGSSVATFGLGSYVLGAGPFVWPEGLQQAIPDGADIVVDCHLQPVGREVVERVRIGLFFSDEPPSRELLRLSLPPAFGSFAGLDIPAGEPAYTLRDSFVLPVDTLVHIIKPHAHYLGRELRLDAVPPGGERRTLIWIDDWRFEWQDAYRCVEPVALPAGTRLDALIVYDNSSANPANPSDPPVPVRFGLQSTDEMGTIGVGLTSADPDDHGRLQNAIRARAVEASLGPDGRRRNPILAARLRLLDSDQDGRVRADEVPNSSRPLFERLDADGDRVLVQSELDELE